MKASEAITILEGLDPSHEVTLNIGTVFKRTKPASTIPSGSIYPEHDAHMWVIDKQFWPKRNEITCKLH